MKRLIAVLVLCAPAVALAHRPGDSFIRLSVDGARIDGRVDLHLRDLQDAVGLDSDGSGTLSGREVREHAAEITAYTVARLQLGADGQSCALGAGAVDVAVHSDGTYAVVRIHATCPAAPRALSLRDDLIFEVDPQHRGLVSVAAGGAVTNGVISDGARAMVVTLGEHPRLAAFTGFVGEGVRHIWGGIDHILFLLALLLPAVIAASRFRPVAGDVWKTVTAFTVAHSLTLALSVLGVVRLPTRFVEPAIAATVLLAALANLLPRRKTRWPVAFYLGLLHGFGFSEVLVDLGLRGGDLAASLLGFNLGVEVGQAAIVAAFLPLAFAMRRTWTYRRLVLIGGSLAVAGCAAMWTLQRLSA